MFYGDEEVSLPYIDINDSCEEEFRKEGVESMELDLGNCLLRTR